MCKEEPGDTQSTRTLQVLTVPEIEDDSDAGYDPYNTATNIQPPVKD